MIYATPDNLRSFRVPNALQPQVKVSDRFHLKPLLRSTTFCDAGYVLALADGGVRLIEVSKDLPALEVAVPDLPTDAASAVGKRTIAPAPTAVASAAARARRCGCASTRGRWTRRCGRSSPAGRSR